MIATNTTRVSEYKVNKSGLHHLAGLVLCQGYVPDKRFADRTQSSFLKW
jgi:hypothetical protein